MAVVAHHYRYLDGSQLSDQGGTPHLHLATSNPGRVAHPHLYEGQFKAPRQAAALLGTVHQVVGSRFFTPAGSVSKAIALADPVITVDGEQLRFEGFSSCCSAYVRADFLPASHVGTVLTKGTTNVDFGPSTRSALARVRDADGLALSIGHEAVRLSTQRDEVIERKVDLPLRWLRGMVEVQSYLANMQERLAFSGVEALHWFRRLPRNCTHHVPLWLGRSAGSLTSSTQSGAGSLVRISDSRRLRVLEPLLPLVRTVRVYADANHQACAWVLEFEGARLTLAMTAEPWRGFSGEGQALHSLMQMAGHRGLSALQAQLHWQPRLCPIELADAAALPVEQVEQGLHVLGASGLLGFDLAQRCYFHRALPFDLSALEELHPRLASAAELVMSGQVIVHTRSPAHASVGTGDSVHSVRLHQDEWRCTCPWHGKHQGQRGPCKHVLAVEGFLAAERQDASTF